MANLPLEGTDDEPRLAEEEECVEVAEEDPAQQDVAQLPPCAHTTIVNSARQLCFYFYEWARTRGPDDGGVLVLEQDEDGEDGEKDSQHRQY